MKFFLLTAFLCAGTAVAQPIVDSSPDSLQNKCEVIYSPRHPRSEVLPNPLTTLGLPSHFFPESPTDFIFDNGNRYVFRLAVCISPYYMDRLFKNDKAEAKKWLKDLDAYLNKVYNRDVGIRFEIIENEKLLLSDYPKEGGLAAFMDHDGTEILDKILGTENYEIGILIRPELGSMSGRARLAGIDANTTKGSAMANTSFATIAHELGHMFGAPHTHQIQGGTCAEPGSGQTLMSYGSDRWFFSTASVRAMRTIVSRFNYYTSNERRDDQFVLVNNDLDLKSFPYVEAPLATKPKLDRSRLRKEYYITNGTYFQFYLTEQQANDEHLLYAAQGNDATFYNIVTNAFQPIFAGTGNSNIMFKPRYHKYNSKNEYPNPDRFTDDFNTGRYTFLLSANNQGRYDVVETKLNIVDGKPFQIKSRIDMDQFCGKVLNLEWEPCTQLYGKDSKVRILLSDDFGKTFRYVLADNVPNTGKWEGFWPYLKIDRTTYEDFGNQVRGGVIKIEVKNEAAYALSHVCPGYFQGDRFVNDGGILLNEDRTYVLFDGAPDCFMEVNSYEEIPEMKELIAYQKRRPSERWQVAGSEERLGNCVRRIWKTQSMDVPYAFTQVIFIKDKQQQEQEQEHISVQNRAEDLRHMANDLYQHKDEIAYPKVSLPQFAAFESAYEKVFDDQGYLLKSATGEDVKSLRASMEALTKIADDEVKRPIAGHYYIIRNYQDTYGRENYWYVVQHPNPNDNSSNPDEFGDSFSNNSAQATQWRCAEENGVFRFTANKRLLRLPPLTIQDEALKLDRGFTWGAFTVLNERGYNCTLSLNGKTFAANDRYAYDPIGYRINGTGVVSSDFQIVPVEFIEAQRTEEEGLCNILTDKNNILIDDAYQYLSAPKAIEGARISYTRRLSDQWEPLYLPFALNYEDWKGQCEVARIDRLTWEDTDNDGRGDRAYLDYVEVKNGDLQPNQPYLIRGLKAGEVKLTVSGAVFGPTEETVAQYGSDGIKAQIKGNYGVVEAKDRANSYTLLDGTLQRGTGVSLPSMRWSLEATSSTTSLPATIALRKKNENAVGTLRITTPEGYATVYTDYSYALPQGVTGYIVTGVDADLQLDLTPVFEGGETVPEHTALLVRGEAREYPLFAAQQAASDGADKLAANLLRGTAGDAITEAPHSEEAFYFYRMDYSDQNKAHQRKLGFYWGKPDGGAFVNEAGSAYLALPVSQASAQYGYTFVDDTPTGIESPVQEAEGLVVYTLTGVRLYPKHMSKLPAGIYIINGKKRIVK